MENPLYIKNNNVHDNNSFAYVADVYTKLKAYDDAYSIYLTCLENNPVYDDKVANLHHLDPSSNYTYTGASCVPPDSTQLLQEIAVLNENMKKMTNSSDASYNEILQKHNDLIRYRNQLDLKLKDLYQLKGSVPLEIQKETDATVFATILWTILATSMIYLIFVIE